MEPTSRCRRAIFISWFNTHPVTSIDNHRKLIIEWFERLIDPCIAYVRKGGLKEWSPTSDSNVVRSLINISEQQLEKFHPKKLVAYVIKKVFTWNDGTFFFVLISSIGITGDTNSRVKFDIFFRRIMTAGIGDEQKKEFGLLDPISTPSKSYCAALLSENFTIYHYKFLSDQVVGLIEGMIFSSSLSFRMRTMCEKNPSILKKEINIESHGFINSRMLLRFPEIYFYEKLCIRLLLCVFLWFIRFLFPLLLHML